MCMWHLPEQRHAIAVGVTQTTETSFKYYSPCRTFTTTGQLSCVPPSITSAGGLSEASTLTAVLSLGLLPRIEDTSSRARLLCVVQR